MCLYVHVYVFLYVSTLLSACSGPLCLYCAPPPPPRRPPPHPSTPLFVYISRCQCFQLSLFCMSLFFLAFVFSACIQVYTSLIFLFNGTEKSTCLFSMAVDPTTAKIHETCIAPRVCSIWSLFIYVWGAYDLLRHAIRCPKCQGNMVHSMIL